MVGFLLDLQQPLLLLSQLATDFPVLVQQAFPFEHLLELFFVALLLEQLLELLEQQLFLSLEHAFA